MLNISFILRSTIHFIEENVHISRIIPKKNHVCYTLNISLIFISNIHSIEKKVHISKIMMKAFLEANNILKSII